MLRFQYLPKIPTDFTVSDFLATEDLFSPAPQDGQKAGELSRAIPQDGQKFGASDMNII